MPRILAKHLFYFCHKWDHHVCGHLILKQAHFTVFTSVDNETCQVALIVQSHVKNESLLSENETLLFEKTDKITGGGRRVSCLRRRARTPTFDLQCQRLNIFNRI